MKPHSTVKNIIFDLGNVILDTNIHLTYHEFQRLGIEDPHLRYQQPEGADLFLSLELGMISPQEFREQIRNHAGKNIGDDQIDHAWNALLLPVPAERIDFLINLKKRYRLFLLSNTNQIHYERFTADYPGLFDVEYSAIFEAAYYSHLLKMRKPGKEIFEFVLEDAAINPANSLFIDDLDQNIEGAAACGLQTLPFNNGMDFKQLMMLVE